MKLFLFSIVISLAFIACGSSKKNESASLDTSVPEEGNYRLPISVTVDGSLKEWPEPLPGYSKETALHFGITNDKDYLFIAVACSEEQVQQKILRTGMEIYISENGKKQTLTGIEFPLPSNRMRTPLDSTDGIRTPAQGIKDYKANQLAQLSEIKTFGLKKTPDGSYPLANQNNIKVAFSRGDNNFFNIEYAIPLKELFTDLTAVNNSKIQVGFKLNAIGNRENNRGAGSYSTAGGGRMGGGGMRGGGMRSGGMRGGGMRGGGMRQGGEGTRGMNNAEISKDQSVWTKYTVSTVGI